MTYFIRMLAGTFALGLFMVSGTSFSAWPSPYKPYQGVTMPTENAMEVSDSFNLCSFDGTKWAMCNGASLGYNYGGIYSTLVNATVAYNGPYCNPGANNSYGCGDWYAVATWTTFPYSKVSQTACDVTDLSPAGTHWSGLAGSRIIVNNGTHNVTSCTVFVN